MHLIEIPLPLSPLTRNAVLAILAFAGAIRTRGHLLRINLTSKRRPGAMEQNAAGLGFERSDKTALIKCAKTRKVGATRASADSP